MLPLEEHLRDHNRNIKLVRCFKGGYNAQQETPIMIALEEFTTKGLITVETLHCERVKKDQMTEKQVVDWGEKNDSPIEHRFIIRRFKHNRFHAGFFFDAGEAVKLF